MRGVSVALGDDSARQWLAAAADTTDNAGLIPTRQLSEVINPLANADRPSIDSISRGTLPDAGMTFEIPKLTQAPTVAVTAEGAAPSDTDQNVAFVTVNVQKFAGQQTFSVELLDRSSPAFFAELTRQMQFAYAKATNARVAAVVGAAATDGGNRTMSAANLLDFISDAAVSVYTNTLGFATNVVVSPEQWGAIMGLIDGSNRPVYVQTINTRFKNSSLRTSFSRSSLRLSRLRCWATSDASFCVSAMLLDSSLLTSRLAFRELLMPFALGPTPSPLDLLQQGIFKPVVQDKHSIIITIESPVTVVGSLSS